MSATDRAYYAANRDKILAYMATPEVRAKGADYRKRLRKRDWSEIQSPERQICSSCRVEKAASEFHRDRGFVSGLANRCKPCKRDSQLRTKYGICTDDWDELFEAQGGRCALCSATTPGATEGWHTDHSHVTGRVRSILCRDCNWAVGCVEKGWAMPSMAVILEYIGPPEPTTPGGN